jgi:hypothetical protein
LTQPVFILGVAPRCGTNYLERLLCLHPDCGLSVPLRQNNLTSILPILAEVSSEVKRQWRDYPNWGFTPDHFDDLDRSLGAGLIDFMLSTTDERRRITELPESMRDIERHFRHSPRYLVTKQPRTTGLGHFRRFFPTERLILLIRDGRAVVESSIRSWGWPFDVAVEGWRRGAADILAYDVASDPDALLVRYEDLVASTEEVMSGVLEFLDLEPEIYDSEAAEDSPILGSSTARPAGATSVDWEPIDPAPSFNPLGRASNWNERQHRRFNHMAGRLLVEMGYEPKHSDTRLRHQIENRLRDGLLASRQVWKGFRHR